MINPIGELKEILSTKAPAARLGVVQAYDSATGVLRILSGGEVIVTQAVGSWQPGDEVLIGSNGQVLGKAPPSRGTFWVD